MNENEETKTNRKQRFGKWLRNNAEELTYAGTYTAIVGGSIGLFVWAVRHDMKVAEAWQQEEKANIEKREALVESAIERGAQALPVGEGGHYWIIEDGKTSLI